MTDLYDQLLLDLECPICKNYMAPPIRQCTTGHSICDSCKTKINRCPLCEKQFSDSRNFTLEALACKMKYPCINRSEGCEIKLTLEEKQQHENKCSFKSFKCAMERCTWVGKVDDILEHWISKKIKSKTYQAFKVCQTKIKPELYYVNLIEAHERLFWFKCKVEMGKIYWAVQFIGCSDVAANYCYEIEIFKPQNIHPRILFTDYCQTVDIENNNLFKEGSCTVINIDCIGHFIGEDQTLKYFLRVHKVEKNDTTNTSNQGQEGERLSRKHKKNFYKQRDRSKGAASFTAAQSDEKKS